MTRHDRHGVSCQGPPGDGCGVWVSSASLRIINSPSEGPAATRLTPRDEAILAEAALSRRCLGINTGRGTFRGDLPAIIGLRCARGTTSVPRVAALRPRSAPQRRTRAGQPARCPAGAWFVRLFRFPPDNVRVIHSGDRPRNDDDVTYARNQYERPGSLPRGDGMTGQPFVSTTLPSCRKRRPAPRGTASAGRS